MYDFSKGVNRVGDGSFKYNMSPMKEDRDIIPMWVADMDFAAPQKVIDALKARADFGVFGYTAPGDEFKNAFVEWMKNRHDCQIDPEWIVAVPGIVPALKVIIQALTKPGEEILIFTPVYHPFHSSIEINNRTVVECPLTFRDGKYDIDFGLLEKTLDQHDVKMIIFCSPHNPVGKVWPRKTLERLGALCKKHNIIMLSDEIHMDFSRAHKHIPFFNAAPAWIDNTIVATAPTKTFNLAGLQVSALIVPDEAKREAIHAVMERNGMESPNIMGLTAAQAAWEHGAEWVDALNETLDLNTAIVREWTEQNMPEVSLVEPDGLYLLWLDCRKMGLSPQELEDFFTKEAKVYLNAGAMFGHEGEGFMRMNIACPPDTVRKALKQIQDAWARHH